MTRDRAALGGDAAAEALVAQEPALLGADIAALLAEVRAAYMLHYCVVPLFEAACP